MGKANRKKSQHKNKQTSGTNTLSLKTSFISSPFFVVGLISVLVFIAYSNIFSYPFYFDDIRTIRDNPALRDLSNYLPFGVWGNRYLGDLSFALNFHFGFINTFGYHLVNVLLHITNAILVWFLVGLLFKTPTLQNIQGSDKYKTPLALLTVLFFALHPVQTQAVTYTVQRYASMATLFYLLSIVMYLKARFYDSFNKKSLTFLALAFIGAFFAMKCKEISFTLPFMIILMEWIFFRSMQDREEGFFNTFNKKKLLYLTPILLTIFVIPYTMFAGSSSGGLGALLSSVGEATTETASITRGQYLMTQFRVVAVYLKLLVLPIGQILDYDFKISTSFFTPLVVLGLLLHLSILAGAFWVLFKSLPRFNSGGGRVLGVLGAFGVFWFYGALSVESSIIPIRDIIFEHRMYLPMTGGALFVLCTVIYGYEELTSRFSKKAADLFRFTLAATVIISVVFTTMTYARNIVWQNSETLWRDVIKKSPTNPRGYNGLGYALYNRGAYAEAIPLFKKSIKIKPDYADVYNNMGIAYFKLPGKLDEAIVSLEKVLELNPTHSRAMNNLGVALSRKGQFKEAEDWLHKSYSLDKTYGRPYYNIGNIYTKSGDPATAIEYYKKSIKVDPEYERPYFNMAVALSMLNKFDESIKYLNLALKIKPDYFQARHNLGAMYYKKEMYQEAIRHFKYVLAVKPDYYDSCFNLAVVYNKLGDKVEAKKWLDKTLALKPNHPGALRMLNDLNR